MEILDNQFSQEPGNGGLQVNQNMRRNWNSTGKWALFFAIFGFIITGLSLLSIGVVMPMMESMLTMSGNSEMAEFMNSAGSAIIGIMVVASIVLFFVHYFHLRFANGIQKAVRFDDQETFESSWRNMRYHFRLMGIIVIAYIVLYAVAIVYFMSTIATKSEF